MNNPNMSQWLAEQIAACKQRGEALKADARQNESTFAQIEANIYEIFQTVLRASADQAFFEARLKEIPANWQRAYDEAAAHGDEKKQHTEAVKLAAAQRIRTAWEERK